MNTLLLGEKKHRWSDTIEKKMQMTDQKALCIYYDSLLFWLATAK